MRILLSILAFMTAAGETAAAAADPPAKPVEVMILGSYHMGNPGLDLANAKVDDVTTPKRQAEIRLVVDELAKWKPTKVLVEIEAPKPFTLSRYREFTPDELATNRNEIWQIGFRLADQLGHQDVYGFDERGGPGEPEYFQWGRLEEFAKKHGKAAELATNLGYFKDKVAAFEREQATKSVAALLTGHNDPAIARQDHSIGYYFSMLYADGDDLAGAEFNTYWYMRNAKMFAKITQIAQPGDRLMVLVGSGHGYWMRHFAGEVPGYRLVDPIPYLKRADRRR
jgi:hypothetical protein